MSYYLKEKSDWGNGRLIPEGMNLNMLKIPNRLDPQFDIVDRLASGKVVVDLGCGTGVIGLRALERGAKFVYFVECDDQMFHIINNVLPGKCDSSKIKLIHKDIEHLTDEDFDHPVDITLSEFYGPRLFDEGYVSYVEHLKSLQTFNNTRFFPDKFGIDFYLLDSIDYSSNMWPPQPELIDHFKFMYKDKIWSGNLARINVSDKEPDFKITFDTKTMIFNNTFEFTYNRNTECLLVGQTYHVTASRPQHYNHVAWYLGPDDYNKTFRISIDKDDGYNPRKIQIC